MHKPLSFKPSMSRPALKLELGHPGKVTAFKPPLRGSATHTLHGRGTGLRDKVCVGDGTYLTPKTLINLKTPLQSCEGTLG